MNIVIACKLAPEDLTAREVYARIKGVTERLAEAHSDFREWWTIPSTEKGQFITFNDEQKLLTLLQEKMDAYARMYPALPLRISAGLLLTNAGNERDWAARGRVALAAHPGRGEIRLEVSRVEEVYAQPHESIWSFVKALTAAGDVKFANTNVYQGLGTDGRLYSLHLGVFPHREFLGWMGYLDQAVRPEQLPDAARVERHGGGTLVMASEKMDLFDPSVVERMNRVEVCLAELGMLPVTDPTFDGR